MNKRKLEKVDLDNLNDIRQSYQENNLQLGSLTADEYIVLQQLKQIEDLKNQCFSKLGELKEKEQQMMLDLEKKYGEGQINLDEEVFIPNV